MKIFNLDDLKDSAKMAEIVEMIKNGALVIYPTETCYGVGVDATNAEAVSKLLRYKNRPPGKPISVAVATADGAFELIDKNPQSENIVNNFLPGPITVVARSKAAVDPRLVSEVETLGVRIPAYPPLLELLAKLERPLTSTSANLSGGKRPYSLPSLLETLSKSKQEMIDIMIDGGELEHNPPSLVIDTTETAKVFRPGLITEEDINSGEVFISKSVDETKKIAANFLTEALRTSDKVIVYLHGELGAGKTQFAGGLGQGLGLNKVISSPSYNIVKEYEIAGGRFYHLDLWRLTESVALLDLGVDVTVGRTKVVAIEWPDKLSDASLASATTSEYTVKILKISPEERRIIITRFNGQGKE